jgi:ATP-binding cassette, subfamily C, bacterial CydC
VAAYAFNYLLPSAGIRLMAIARTGARYGERLLGHEAALRTMARIRPMLFGAIAHTPPGQALRIAIGEAATSLVQDVHTVEAKLVQRSAPWGAAAALAAGLSLTASASASAAASTAACLVAAFFATKLLARPLRRSAAAVRDAMGALKDELALLGASAAELRCYGLEARAAELAAQRSRALGEAQTAHARLASRIDGLLAAVAGIAAAIAIALARDQGAPLAALAGLAAAMAVDGAAPLLRGLLQDAAFTEAARRMEALLAAPAMTAFAGDDEEEVSPAELGLPSAPARWPVGARIAIVGASGCGKTTLVEMLLGLREAPHGVAHVAGRDIADCNATLLRAQFAWLPQNAALVTGTVRENLLLACPQADEPAMWGALRDAALAQCVQALPQGLDTWIGSGGVQLSGGEQRRLALARAYLSHAPWMLLDEPTEGLDAFTERTVLDRLAARLDRTGQGLIVVTHRPAAMALCDEILRMPQGSIAASAAMQATACQA